jgi:lysophospholipid acyltransferase (LPLAT)-like uncharacterized protein
VISEPTSSKWRTVPWFSTAPLLRLGVAALRLHARTLRLRVEGEEPVAAHLAAGGRVVFSSWHQRFYGGICYFARYRPVIMISQSRDGEIIARLVDLLGWKAARGSGTRGGHDALAAIVEELKHRQAAGHIVDGPRGPTHRIKPGIVVLAQRTGAHIVPVYVGYARPWEAKSWDRFQVPRPFSRTLLRFGLPREVPAELGGEALDRWRGDLDSEFEREYARVDADVARWDGARAARVAG